MNTIYEFLEKIVFISIHDIIYPMRIIEKDGTLLLESKVQINPSNMRFDSIIQIDMIGQWAKNQLNLYGKIDGTPVIFLSVRPPDSIRQSAKIKSQIEYTEIRYYHFISMLYGADNLEEIQCNEARFQLKNLDSFINDDVFNILESQLVMYQTKKYNLFIANILQDDTCSSKPNEITYFIKYSSTQNYTTILKEISELYLLFNILCRKPIFLNSIILLGEKEITLYLNDISFKKNIKNRYDNIACSFIPLCLNEIHDDLGSIIDTYYDKKIELLPIIELYIDLLQHNPSSLCQFLYFTQIIEYCANTFNYAIARNLAKNNHPTQKNNIYLSDKIESIIVSTNNIFGFSITSIVSDKIAKARNYYIHHDPKKEQDKFSFYDLIKYTYFLDDLVIFYIYQLLGIKKNVIQRLKNCLYIVEEKDLI